MSPDTCTRGHQLWPGRFWADTPCPLYGCKGTVRGDDDGLASDREPRDPPPATRPPLEVEANR